MYVATLQDGYHMSAWGAKVSITDAVVKATYIKHQLTCVDVDEPHDAIFTQYSKHLQIYTNTTIIFSTIFISSAFPHIILNGTALAPILGVSTTIIHVNRTCSNVIFMSKAILLEHVYRSCILTLLSSELLLHMNE